MSEYSFLVDIKKITDTECFKEASKEELRVLLALISRGGVADKATLASLAGVSESRTASSITLWREAGVLTDKSDSGAPSITEEFEEILRRGQIDYTPSKEVAKNIRDEDLSDMISACAAIMGKAALSPSESASISALYMQYKLQSDFIITLASDMSERGKLTVRRLVDEAIRLVGLGIDDITLLNDYIKNRDEQSALERELKRDFGIFNRNFTKSEREYIKKWSEELGYSKEIIGEAYDVTALSTGKLSFQYMNKLLTKWHEADCKTVEDCRAFHEKDRVAYQNKNAKNLKKEEKTHKMKYGDFDPDEAFKRALERSYGKDSD